MRLELYYSSKVSPFEAQDNRGFSMVDVLQLLEGLQQRGLVRYEVTDTGLLPAADLHRVYAQAALPAIWKGRTGYSIRRVFGSRRKSAVWFGRDVPALLVYEAEEERPTDVYPHRVGDASITIRDFLDRLS